MINNRENKHPCFVLVAIANVFGVLPASVTLSIGPMGSSRRFRDTSAELDLIGLHPYQIFNIHRHLLELTIHVGTSVYLALCL